MKTAKIERQFSGNGTRGDILTERSRMVFGPPENSDLDATALVISAKIGSPDPTDDDWRDAIRALRVKYPERAIYLLNNNHLAPVGFYNSAKGQTASDAVAPPSAHPGMPQQMIDITKTDDERIIIIDDRKG